MKTSIKTIIFDLGHVIVTDTTKVLEDKYRFDDMSKSKRQKYIRAFHQSESGKIPSSELLKVIHETLIPDMTPKQIEKFITSTPLQAPWKLALRLKKLGYQIIIFSNNQKTWPKKIARFNKVDFHQFPFVNSGVVGLRKPNLNFYNYLLKKYKVNPKATIFVDDRAKNLPPAKQLGIKTFHYKQNYRDLIKFLKQQKIKGL